jgi:hypothetical protein
MRTLIVPFSIILTLGIARSDARADWYTDARDIIEQVIETNISTQVIPNAAARVPALCAFFPSSLAAIQAQRYTGLQTVLRKEVADAVGYEVFRYLSGSPLDISSASPANALATYARDFSNAQLPKTFAIAPAMAQLGGQQADAAQETCVALKDGKLDFDNVTSIATIQLQKCAPKLEPLRSTLTKRQPNTGTTSSDPQELPCAAAVLISDSLDDQHDALPGDLVRLLRAMLGDQEASIADLLAGLASRQTIGLDAALAIAVSIATTCQQQMASCHRVHDWLTRKQDVIDDVVAIMNLLRTHNYGGATAKLLHLVVDVKCDDTTHADNPACTKQGQAVRAFLEALAVVVIDSATSGKATASAEADFKTAAVNMIAQAGGLGYTRNSATARAVLYPQLTLRDSWRPGNSSIGASATMKYASLDTLTFRPKTWYKPSWYIAPQLSLLDLLGPFSEIATRGHVFDHAGDKPLVFGLGFLAPRAEVMLGSPVLSRNLVVGAGLTVRAYRGVMTSPTTGEYCVLGKACVADQNGRGITWDNLEVGVYIRYIP